MLGKIEDIQYTDRTVVQDAAQHNATLSGDLNAAAQISLLAVAIAAV